MRELVGGGLAGVIAWGVLLAVVPCASAQDAEAGMKKAEVCVACHGAGGNSTQPLYPVLAGQTHRYIYLQLKDFKEGRRDDPQMTPFAKSLSKQDMLDLSAYFAGQKPMPIVFEPDPERVARGEQTSADSLCTMCHLGGLAGQNEIPRVAGQHPEYVIRQMENFKAGLRTNDAGNMASVSKSLSTDDILDLAHYIASLY